MQDEEGSDGWFAGFQREFVSVDRVDDEGEIEIFAMTAGSGPPLLLLHGFPQTHVMWRKVAPALAEDFTVVAADLRGYGHSGKPPGEPGHRTYAKRTMAADQVALMAALGHESFSVMGHDRGGRVAHQMAIDHRDAVERLVLLDILPTLDVFAAMDAALATAYFHWLFLIQEGGLPEAMIGAAPDAFLAHMLGISGGEPEPEAFAVYAAAFRDAAAIHAACEDYRAGATVDCAHQEADRAADRRIEAPLRVVWGSRGVIGRRFDCVAAWQRVARGPVTGESVEAGHYLAEEAPEATLAAVLPFLAGDLSQ